MAVLCSFSVSKTIPSSLLYHKLIPVAAARLVVTYWFQHNSKEADWFMESTEILRAVENAFSERSVRWMSEVSELKSEG